MVADDLESEMTDLERRSKDIMGKLAQGNGAYFLNREDAEALIRRAVEWSRCAMPEEQIPSLVEKMLKDFKWMSPEQQGPAVAPWIDLNFSKVLDKAFRN